MRLPFDIGNLKFDFVDQWKARQSNKMWLFLAAYVEKQLQEKRNTLENCSPEVFAKTQGEVSAFRVLKNVLEMENIEPTLTQVVEFTNK